MADEHKFGPFHVDYDITEVYDGISTFFAHSSSQFHVSAKHFDDEDRFSIDFVRNYSFIASEYKATVHMRAREAEDGGTDLFYDIASNEDEAKLQESVCDRVTNGTVTYIKKLRNEALEEPDPKSAEEIAAEEKREKNKLIIVGIIAAVIVIGCIPAYSGGIFSF